MVEYYELQGSLTIDSVVPDLNADPPTPLPTGSVVITAIDLGQKKSISSGTVLIILNSQSVADSAVAGDNFTQGTLGEDDAQFLSRYATQLQSMSNVLNTAKQIEAYVLSTYTFVTRAKAYDLTNSENDRTQAAADAPGYISLFVYGDGKPLSVFERQTIYSDLLSKSMAGLQIVIQDMDILTMTVTATTQIAEGSDFVPGNAIEIEMGYGNSRELVYAGILLSQRMIVKKNISYLEITCKDKAVKLSKGRFTNVYTDATDSDTFGKIASKFGLNKDIDSTKVTFGQLVQHYCSYWDFILMRAEMNNQIVITENNELKIKDIDLRSSAVISIQADMVVLEADLDIDAEDIVKEFNVVSWDESNQQITSASSNVSDSLNLGNIPTQKLSDVLSGITSNRLSSASLTKDELQNI